MMALLDEVRCSCGYSLREFSKGSDVRRCVHCDRPCVVKKQTGVECPRCVQQADSERAE